MIEKLVDEFAKLNNIFWSDVYKDSKNKILVDGFCPLPYYLVAAATITKVINNVKHYEPMIILSNNLTNNNEVKKMFSSYGIKKYIGIRRHRFNIFIILKAIITTLNVYITFPNLDMFINYELEGIKIGDLIYDTYIRHKNRYRNIKLKSLSFFKLMLKSHFLFYLYKHIIKLYKIKYVILSDVTYSNGILARIAINNNSKVITCPLTSARCYYNYNDIFENLYKPSKKVINIIKDRKLYKKSEAILKKRFKGGLNQHDVINAYKGKKVYSKNNLIKELGLNPSYPIVGIMSHVFSDAPHSNEHMIFRDFYEWFIETIKWTKSISNINWIVKAHPSAYMYGEEGEVEKLLSNLNLKNIYLAPLNLSTYSIFCIAKTIITVSGTAGIEAACNGIMPILAGKSFYSDFGITYQPKDKVEYFSLLKNIQDISFLLKEEQIKIAKSIFYWRFRGCYPISTIISSKTIFPFKDQNVMIKQKEEVYREMIEKLKRNNPLHDPYYLLVKKFIIKNEKYLFDIK